MATNQPANHRSSTLPKSPTGIQGLDEITGGGLPTGRPTLVCGSAGCGKTMLAMEFLVRGATQFDEPGVFMMFEENAAELTANVRSLVRPQGQLNNRVKVPVGVSHNVVAESNCVIAKWGGEQLEAKRQSVG